MTKYLILVGLVAALSETTWALDAGCDYYQNVAAGATYYVFNSEYPGNYTGARSCRWYARSETNVILSCQIFSLPATPNCVRDRVSISPSGDLQLADARNYCGTGTFEITSTGNSINIVFTSYAGTTGGKFLCTLRATPAVIPNCSCGWKKQTRIVGGAATGVNEYPMMAGLVNLDLRLLYCGATIISTKHCITAAHCRPANTPINRLAILTGDYNISSGTDTTAASLHLVSAFVSHPNYNSETQANDIAVITVADTIIFSMDVGPACMPFKYAANTFSGSKVDALGWGTLEFAGARSDVLQKVQLDVTSTATCQQSFPTTTNNQMCTYTPGKDACQFDSGGPLLWQNPETMRLVLAGVISYGEVCADTKPGVNTRVGGYVPWILSVTPGVNYCRVE